MFVICTYIFNSTYIFLSTVCLGDTWIESISKQELVKDEVLENFFPADIWRFQTNHNRHQSEYHICY